jgi:hypothetical protein
MWWKVTLITLLVVKQATLGFTMALEPQQFKSGDKGMITLAGSADPAIQVAQAILGTRVFRLAT